MKHPALTLVLAAGLWAPNAASLKAQTLLASGHTDVGIAFEEGAWELHIGRHHDDPPAEYAPGAAVLRVEAAAQTTVPAAPAFQFLGAAGSPVYVLPQAEAPGQLFLGFGTEELEAGLFRDDRVVLGLSAVRGPGRFAVYEVDPLGRPGVLMNSGDGIDAGDSVTLAAGGHRHVNWAFSAPGVYEVDFDASGVLAATGELTSSGPATYTFAVVPEPGALAMLATGGLGLAAVSLRRKHRGPARV